MSVTYHYFAPCARGLEPVVAGEIRSLGAAEVTQGTAGVAFTGSLEVGYRACFWCRSASRVLLRIDMFTVKSPDDLYRGARTVRWEEHLTQRHTFKVDFTSVGSPLTHTNYGAQVVKDAIVDRFRDQTGIRPDVDRRKPDIRVAVHVREDMGHVYLDLSGERLHRRSWRVEGGEAPLKESLAAGVLMMASWHTRFQSGAPLVDPMCGSGSLLVEAALIACDVAPGLLREGYGFDRWLGHDPGLYQRIVKEARQRDRRKDGPGVPILGTDTNPAVTEHALENLHHAGIQGVTVLRRELAMVDPPAGPPGLLVTNPPYGVRLGEADGLGPLYRRIGVTLKSRFPGWTGFVLTGNLEAAKHLGLRVTKRHLLFNGAIECRLLEIPVLDREPESSREIGGSAEHSQALSQASSDEPVAGSQAELAPGPKPVGQPAGVTMSRSRSASVEMFSNRVKKNLNHLRKWREKDNITCFRLYDCDLPEYAITVDVYERWLHVQESERPPTLDPLRAEERLHDALAVLPELAGVSGDSVFFKQRHRQGPSRQYSKLASTGMLREVKEGGLKFLVNLTDYLDTGIFLDYRTVRSRIRDMAEGRRFLNLFAYTCSATVYAAAGRAKSTTSVDLSATYLEWGRRNLELNGFRGLNHSFVQANVLEWLNKERHQYDLILLDPPTFSNSKSMRGSFDVQRDHVLLIQSAARMLSPGGILIFSNNFRKFKLDDRAFIGMTYKDISASTIPLDYARDPKAHMAWVAEKAGKPLPANQL